MKNSITLFVKAFGIAAVSAAVSLMALSSCDNTIYDYEGDCVPSYTLKLKYDKNLKWADAFANEVKSVRLFAFDTNGTLVKEWFENSQVLQNDDYAIDLDIPAGKYRLVAWCGTENPEAEAEHFAIPQTTIGQTNPEQLTCKINRTANTEYPALSDKRLEFLFHGELDVELPADDDGGDYVYTMPLTKNTNHLRVVLQHLSGKDLDVSKFSFRLEDANGLYHHSNKLLDDQTITYKAYKTSSGVASIIREEQKNTRNYVDAKTAIADISTGRMMADRKRNMILTITNDEGKDIACVPVIDYALMAKDYYEDAYGHRMTDQEYLDRNDEYVMTFFIDDNMEWYSAEIYILSWRIVLHDYSIKS